MFPMLIPEIPDQHDIIRKRMKRKKNQFFRKVYFHHMETTIEETEAVCLEFSRFRYGNMGRP